MSKRCQIVKKMSICQKDVKLSKRCQMSKSQTHTLWSRFTKKIIINSNNEVHTYWCKFWCQIWRSLKLFKNTFYAHFESFWWPSYVTSEFSHHFYMDILYMKRRVQMRWMYLNRSFRKLEWEHALKLRNIQLFITSLILIIT